MNKWLLRLNLTGDRVLRILLGLLALILLGSVVFTPPELPPLAQATGDVLSFDETQTMNGRVTQILAQETIETGSDTLRVQVVPSAEWITVNRTEWAIKAGKSARVRVTLADPPPESLSSIEIHTGHETFKVPVQSP